MTSLRRAPQKRLRSTIVNRRATPHPFVPLTGHPELCSACNARRDDEHSGRFIHPTA